MTNATSTIKLSELTRTQRIELILTTISTRHIDALEREFVGQVTALPRLRTILFEVARQGAAYRQAQLPNAGRSKPLSEKEASRVHALKVPELISLMLTTTDPRIVDVIEECTIERLPQLLTFRKALFTVVRRNAEYRSTQRVLELK